VTKYDPVVIQSYADRLYLKARVIIFLWTLAGALIGGAAGVSIGYPDEQKVLSFGLIGAVLIGILGFLAGSERAFGLKLQVQVVLCQKQIEENTRARAAASRGL
jgi:hypothetical protein